MNQRFAKLPLERIFKGDKARVLDHLASTIPFDFSPLELAKILKIDVIRIDGILEHLENNQLVEFTKNKKYKLSTNIITKALRQLQYEIATNDIDKIILMQKTKEANSQ